jgi:hypothetical protein
MNDHTSQKYIPISELKIGKVQATEVLHFTGGLIATLWRVADLFSAR